MTEGCVDVLPEDLNSVFSVLEELEEQTLQTFLTRMQTPCAMYTAHFLLWGAGNRTISQIRGFDSMLRDRNFTCSSAILRMQLDTVLRLFGGFEYGNLAEYAERIFQGERVSKLKSKGGQYLHDKYLVDELSRQLPWIGRVYDRSSGSVHLSRRHIMLALGPVDEEGHCDLRIGPSDTKVDEIMFIELGQAFAHTSTLAIQMIEEWFDNMPVKGDSSS